MVYSLVILGQTVTIVIWSSLNGTGLLPSGHCSAWCTSGPFWSIRVFTKLELIGIDQRSHGLTGGDEVGWVGRRVAGGAGTPPFLPASCTFTGILPSNPSGYTTPPSPTDAADLGAACRDWETSAPPRTSDLVELRRGGSGSAGAD